MTDTNTAGREAATDGKWYMVNKDGMATLCADEADAEREAADAQAIWPGMGPHRAVQLVEAGRASLAANAGREPVAYAIFAENGNIRLWATEPQHVKRIAAEQGLKLVKIYTHHSPPEGMAGWRPIETAPEKGVFLVYMPTADRDGDRIQVAVWHPNVKVVGHLFAFDCAPITHWMPLPAPPLPASEAKEM